MTVGEAADLDLGQDPPRIEHELQGDGLYGRSSRTPGGSSGCTRSPSAISTTRGTSRSISGSKRTSPRRAVTPAGELQDSCRQYQGLGLIPPKSGNWDARADWIFQPENVFQSVEALQEAQQRDNTSLGLIKPGSITDFVSRG